ncbi:hypothetical protein GCM10023405_20080 [Streptomonospora salina]
MAWVSANDRVVDVTGENVALAPESQELQDARAIGRTASRNRRGSGAHPLDVMSRDVGDSGMET